MPSYPTLKEAAKAAEVVTRFLAHLQDIMAGVTAQPAQVAESQPRHGRVGRWRQSVLAVLTTEARPLTSREITKFVVDIKGIEIVKDMDSVDQAIRNTLSSMKKAGELQHNEIAGTWALIGHQSVTSKQSH